MDICVTLFEDNELVREALQSILNSTPGFICSGAFADGDRWESDISESEPDVVLMDIEMPGLNGIEIMRKIFDSFPHIKILMQTVFNDKEKIFFALCAGASGYVLKYDPPHKFIQAINEVYNGGAPVSSAVARKVLGFFADQEVIPVSADNKDYHLSEKEKEILSLMIEALNYEGIAEKAFMSYETVHTHMKNIYKKLHITSRYVAVMKAMQQGLS